MRPLLHIKDLQTGFASKTGKPLVLHSGLNFELLRSMFVAVLGPNGAGKSTLLRTLLGYQKALAGEIYYDGDLLETLSVSELARKTAVILTDKIDESFLTVYDIVATGRYPYTGVSGRLGKEDEQQVADAIGLVGMDGFADRYFHRLSDGERQKVMIARAIAQQTALVVLDEPVAFIDAPSKIEIMELLFTLSHKHGKGILMATHDLEAAVRFSDVLWLLGTNGESVAGNPGMLLENGTLNHFFDKKNIVLNKKKMIFEKKD